MFLLCVFIRRQGFVVDGSDSHLFVNDSIHRAESTLPSWDNSVDDGDTTDEREHGIVGWIHESCYSRLCCCWKECRWHWEEATWGNQDNYGTDSDPQVTPSFLTSMASPVTMKKWKIMIVWTPPYPRLRLWCLMPAELMWVHKWRRHVCWKETEMNEMITFLYSFHHSLPVCVPLFLFKRTAIHSVPLKHAESAWFSLGGVTSHIPCHLLG